MHYRSFSRHLCAVTLTLGLGLSGQVVAANADPLKIGLILPMTGQQSSTGRQIDAAVKLYMAHIHPTIDGRKVEVIVKDDAGTPDTTRRLAQELIVNDKVVALAGFGITPSAMATAPLATQSKTPMVVMAAAPRRSPRLRRSWSEPASRCRRSRSRSPNGLPRTTSRRSSRS
jgi:branched-chain amino acid transport system substrate-binding protein